MVLFHNCLSFLAVLKLLIHQHLVIIAQDRLVTHLVNAVHFTLSKHLISAIVLTFVHYD